MDKYKISWTSDFQDLNNILCVGGQIEIDGKIYRHAVIIDQCAIDKAKKEVIAVLARKINGLN